MDFITEEDQNNEEPANNSQNFLISKNKNTKNEITFATDYYQNVDYDQRKDQYYYSNNW